MMTQYVNKDIDAPLLALKTHKVHFLAGMHRQNEIQERCRKEINRYLMFHKDIKDSWSEALPLLQRILNAQHIDSI